MKIPLNAFLVKRLTPDMMDKNPSCSLLQDLGRFSAQSTDQFKQER